MNVSVIYPLVSGVGVADSELGAVAMTVASAALTSSLSRSASLTGASPAVTASLEVTRSSRSEEPAHDLRVGPDRVVPAQRARRGAASFTDLHTTQTPTRDTTSNTHFPVTLLTSIGPTDTNGEDRAHGKNQLHPCSAHRGRIRA